MGKKVDITNLNLEETSKAKDYSWQILYADESNIYLISANYIRITDCPKKESYALSGSGYTSTLLGIVEGYPGIGETTKKVIIPDMLKGLNKDFLAEHDYNNENPNMKAVAYMLDTEIWKEQFLKEKLEKDSDSKVSFVIGGPSIELLIKAYNAYNGTEYSSQANEIGYKIDDGKGLNINKDYFMRNPDGSYNSAIVLNTIDIDGKTKNANSMWISSPSAVNAEAVMRVRDNGTTNYDYYSNDAIHGFRPIICLKSNVHLEKQEEGNFVIK